MIAKNNFICDFNVDYSERWLVAKALRMSILGASCELCDSADGLVGHHIIGREDYGQVDVIWRWSNCQNRCYICEVSLHRSFCSGNSTRSGVIQENNNLLITKTLHKFPEQMDRVSLAIRSFEKQRMDWREFFARYDVSLVNLVYQSSVFDNPVFSDWYIKGRVSACGFA